VKAGFVLKPTADKNLKNLYFKIKKIFEKKGISVYIDMVSAKLIGILGMDFE
jgi:NAD+ kinase